MSREGRDDHAQWTKCGKSGMASINVAIRRPTRRFSGAELVCEASPIIVRYDYPC